ncbi:putative tetratricopeptide-like helical domain superfamily [Helianthus annuus]|nr:putative tetratricopeptide-like helical domain superfamily [Helianthus annuus]KAJ0554715.1 putative tetratricopeptide-like helical domain superfamily [Helianthus annuus]KAJ0720278.1 putative tetratricopeptide-like helical domain superfamily [Helianthus annuus]KAJ0723495.1 putative tetratricopeptide-like helical domain superfamily [Helianthus annuus]KAJ0899295.1 putative tetratricopeptide-like helical domain superfamily [Helianthus annuus]
MTYGKLCALSLDFWGSQQVQDLVVKEGFEHDLYVSTCLVDMYAKLGKMDCAQKLFDEMPVLAAKVANKKKRPVKKNRYFNTTRVENMVVFPQNPQLPRPEAPPGVLVVYTEGGENRNTSRRLSDRTHRRKIRCRSRDM